MRAAALALLLVLPQAGVKASDYSLKGLHVIVHVARNGESAESLIQRYKTTRGTLESMNPGVNLEEIRPGDRIKILSRPGVFQKLQRTMTISDLSFAYQISVDELMKANDIRNPKRVIEGAELFVPDRNPLPKAKLDRLKRHVKKRQVTVGSPKYLIGKPLGVSGRMVISDGYGSRRHPLTGAKQKHSGIDLVAAWGTPILAAKDGVVTFAGWKGGYGKLVVIKHDGGYETYYAHATEISVKEGEEVVQGGEIGRVGATGDVTAPHLHFELRRWGALKNPTTYLRRYL